jgi:hypothetical protein
MSAARTAIAPEEENKIKVQNPRQRSSGLDAKKTFLANLFIEYNPNG